MASNVRGILSLRNDIQTKSEFQKKIKLGSFGANTQFNPIGIHGMKH